MKFLLDQDVYASTAHFPEGLGHDVVTPAGLGLSRASDSDLLTYLAHVISNPRSLRVRNLV